MKKLLIFISIFAVLITCAALSLFANASEVILDDGAAITTAATVTALDMPGELLDTPAVEAEGEVLISEAVKEFINKYLAEIASIAGFVLTAILTFLYKKGLLPVISKGFSKLVDSLNIFKGNVEERISAFGKDSKLVVEQMNKAIDECAKMKESFDQIQVMFAEQEEQKKQLENKMAKSDARDMLTCELLCQLLMCTNVPQYMKDKVAAYYEQTKATIEKGEAVTSDDA